MGSLHNCFDPVIFSIVYKIKLAKPTGAALSRQPEAACEAYASIKFLAACVKRATCFAPSLGVCLCNANPGKIPLAHYPLYTPFEALQTPLPQV